MAQSGKIPYGTQWLDSDDESAVLNVLRSGFITQGPAVGRFETALARFTGAKYAVAVSNGTAALHLAALALGLKKGDEVITTPISFLATSNAILYAGAKPVFADIDPVTYCLSPESAEKRINRRTKAIFLTHFAGYPVDMKPFRRLADRYGLVLLEDAAHALGARRERQMTGSCRDSKAAIFSFHPVKHITTGEGGAVTTNDRSLYQTLIDLRSHGVTKDKKRLKDKKQGEWYYEMQMLGFNYRLTDIQAALGLSQMEKLPLFLKKRRQIAREYDEAFTTVPGLKTPQPAPGDGHSYHLYPVCFEIERIRGGRRRIFDELQRQDLGVQVHYIPIPHQPFYRRLGYTMKDLPNAREYYKRTVSLPLFPKMKKNEIIYTIRTVKSVLKSLLM